MGQKSMAFNPVFHLKSASNRSTENSSVDKEGPPATFGEAILLNSQFTFDSLHPVQRADSEPLHRSDTPKASPPLKLYRKWTVPLRREERPPMQWEQTPPPQRYGQPAGRRRALPRHLSR
ncbi:unnamed protein product [Pleuronectes platessa]|uniref:Uncharacterized protein n=1 Tax=Pleuronectes platessa TaxID=8262 RepID=A0A9N7YRC1_PLEPL|nr:unnamed protein product [Pleuronectes platessa]